LLRWWHLHNHDAVCTVCIGFALLLLRVAGAHEQEVQPREEWQSSYTTGNRHYCNCCFCNCHFCSGNDNGRAVLSALFSGRGAFSDSFVSSVAHYCYWRLLSLLTLLLLATAAAATTAITNATATATAVVTAAVTTTHVQKEKLNKRQREAAALVQPSARFRLNRRIASFTTTASTAGLAYSAVAAAADTVVVDQKQQQQLQAVTVSAVTASGVIVSGATTVLVPAAPELHGMHALNTLYSDLEPAAVRSNVTVTEYTTSIAYTILHHM
jgi:hypothetical protein